MLLLLAGMVSWRGVEWPLVTCALDEIQILQWLSMSYALGSEVSDFKSSALGYPHVCLRVQVADAAPHLNALEMNVCHVFLSATLEVLCLGVVACLSLFLKMSVRFLSFLVNKNAKILS